jgi:G:T/U-mismatch repair DNA glycosylase
MNHGIALSDTARIVRREKWNASDAHLEVVESIDLPETLLEIPHCHTLVTTGELATRTLFSLF